MVTEKVYTLIKKDIPNVTKRRVIEDINVGGVKLVYKVKIFKHKEIKLFGKKKPKVMIPWPYQIKHDTLVVLRPYKDNWDTKRNKLPRNYWGKKTDPLTNMWIEVEFDYDNINKDIVIFKDQIKNHVMEKHLKRVDKQFTMFSNTSINP